MKVATRAEGRQAPAVEIEVIRDVERLQAARTELATLPFTRLDADLDVYLANLDNAAGARPHVVLARVADRLVGAVLARRVSTQLETKLGYRTRLSSRVVAIESVSGGVVADESVATALVSALDVALREREADACIIPSIAPDAPFTAAFHSFPVRRRTAFEPCLPRFVADASDSFEDYLRRRPAKERSNMRRGARRLPTLMPAATVRRFRQPEELDELLELLERVAGTTWQRRLNGGFLGRPAEIATYRLATAAERFRCWVLLDGQRPVAFALGWIYRGRYFGRYTGFDPEYAALGPGAFVHHVAIADLCADPEVSVLDFGPGVTEAKRHLADRAELETDLVAFAPTARLLCVNALRSGGNGFASLARRGLADVPALRRLGRAWRGHVAQKNTRR